MVNNVCCIVMLEEGCNWLVIDYKVWLVEVGLKNWLGLLLVELWIIFLLYWGVGCIWLLGLIRWMFFVLMKEVWVMIIIVIGSRSCWKNWCIKGLVCVLNFEVWRLVKYIGFI